MKTWALMVVSTVVLVLSVLQGAVAANAATPATGEAATASADCDALAAGKPAVLPTVAVEGQEVVVRLPLASLGCGRVVRVLGVDGGPVLLPVDAATRTVRTALLAGGVAGAQYKVVAADDESPWSEVATLAAPSTRVSALAALTVVPRNGGVTVGWRRGTPARVVDHYRVRLVCGGSVVLRASVGASIASLWVPVPAGERCRVGVAGVGADGHALTRAAMSVPSTS